MNNNLLNIKEASEYLNTSKETLRNWDKSGKLPSIKTVGGHRRYQKEKLDELIGIINTDEISDVVATYARVTGYRRMSPHHSPGSVPYSLSPIQTLAPSPRSHNSENIP